MATRYPDAKYSDSLEVGKLFQEFISKVLKHCNIQLHYYANKQEQYEIGESREGYEVKLDMLCTSTGRLSIEIGEKTRASLPFFTLSGIMRKDNTIWYVQGNYQQIWVFLKSRICKYFSEVLPTVISDNPPTIQKFYLPIQEANKIAKFVITVKQHPNKKIIHVSKTG